MKNRNRWGRAWLLAVGVLAWLAPALAVAQDFQKVNGPLREELPATPFVAAAYGFIWIALLAYVVWLARGVGRVRKDLAELRGRIGEQADRGGPRP
ncbi:MAG TPA: CcmD family protein [Polyangia bacterium]|jgi:CcmD family protein|nr:CcmD family protein [Polyangia bacterium]